MKASLDPGSQNSFITEGLFKRFHLKSYYNPFNISGIGLSDSVAHAIVNIAIYSATSCYKHTIPKITCELPQVKIDFNKLHIPENMPLADDLRLTF